MLTSSQWERGIFLGTKYFSRSKFTACTNTNLCHKLYNECTSCGIFYIFSIRLKLVSVRQKLVQVLKLSFNKQHDVNEVKFEIGNIMRRPTITAHFLSLHKRAGVAGSRSALTSYRLKYKALIQIRHLFI